MLNSKTILKILEQEKSKKVRLPKYLEINDQGKWEDTADKANPLKGIDTRTEYYFDNGNVRIEQY